jgi:hypothetical protein
MKLLYARSFVLTILIFLSICEICSQTHLKLILKTTLPIDSALIVHFTNQESSMLTYNDTLDIYFKIPHEDFYHINYMQKGKVFNEKVYLDSGDITIFMKIENDKLLIEKVIGSPMFENVQNWKKQYAVVAKDSATLDSFLLKTYEEQIENLFSFSIGLRYLNIHQNNKLKLYALLPLMARQDAQLKKQFGFSMLNNRLQGIIKSNMLRLPTFELIDAENNTMHAVETNSNFVILDFWFVACLPCVEDHKRISKSLSFLTQNNTTFISISNDDSYPVWKSYLEKHKYAWPQYKKPRAVENIISHLGISTYPTYILLNKQGEILFSTYSLMRF